LEAIEKAMTGSKQVQHDLQRAINLHGGLSNLPLHDDRFRPLATALIEIGKTIGDMPSAFLDHEGKIRLGFLARVSELAFLTRNINKLMVERGLFELMNEAEPAIHRAGESQAIVHFKKLYIESTAILPGLREGP
jgi:hypothetical protein